MIAKLIKGRGFRGALEYDLTKENGRILDTSMAGETPRQLAAEFGEIRKLRPNLGRAVVHVSLSAALGEKLTDGQWIEIGQCYLRGMGYKDNQYLVTRHYDTDHEHIHILVNRITLTGQVVSDGLDYKRQEVIMREIELKYGLQRVVSSIYSERKAPTRGEIEYAVRTGKPSTRNQLQKICDAAAHGCSNFTDYLERLALVGVDVITTLQHEGSKLSGIQYRLDDVVMKGSDLGKAYAAAGIQKRGISYEQKRDFTAIERCREREASRELCESNRKVESGKTSECQGIGNRIGAIGSGDGNSDREVSGELGQTRQHEAGTKPRVGSEIRRNKTSVSDSNNDSNTSGRAAEQSSSAAENKPLSIGASHWGSFRGARERILALAGTTTNDSEHARSKSGNGVAETITGAGDPFERQIAALGCNFFELQLHHPINGQQITCLYDIHKISQQAAWLNSMNAKGFVISIQPFSENGLVMLNGLSGRELQQLSEDGLLPAAIVEVSPENYQVWLKLAPKLSDELKREAKLDLMRCYGIKSVASNLMDNVGLLAGFGTASYDHNGRESLVLLHESNGEIAPAGAEYLGSLTQRLKSKSLEAEKKRRIASLCNGSKPDEGVPQPMKEYWNLAQPLVTVVENDYGDLDFSVAKLMANSGRFTMKDIAMALRYWSPLFDMSQPRGHGDYADYIAQLAWSAAGVQNGNVETPTEHDVVSASKTIVVQSIDVSPSNGSVPVVPVNYSDSPRPRR